MIICGFMLLLTGGCTRKGADLNPENQDFIVHLKGEVASRVHLGEGNGSYPVLWESGDRIIVFGGTEQQPGSIYVTDDGECRTARFREILIRQVQVHILPYIRQMPNIRTAASLSVFRRYSITGKEESERTPGLWSASATNMKCHSTGYAACSNCGYMRRPHTP